MKRILKVYSLFLGLLLWQTGYSQPDYIQATNDNSQTSYSSLSPLEHVAANLLILSGSSQHTKTGAKILYSMIDPEQIEAFDLAALKLSRLGTTYPDTNAWLIKALSKVPNQRYLDLLKELKYEIELKNKDESSYERQIKNNKTLKQLKKAIKTISKNNNDGNHFNVNELDFDRTYDALLLTNSQKKIRGRDIDSPNIGQNLEQLYTVMGPPNTVDIWGKNVRFIIPIVLPGAVGGQEIDFLINNFSLTYDGFAIYNFHFNENQYTIKKITRISSDANDQTPWQPVDQYGDVLKSVPDTLMPADGNQATKIARILIHKKEYKEQYLDLSAKKIWAERTTEDREMINAIAHLARFIGESKNSRYVTILENTLNETKKRKARKHIKRALTILPKDINNTQQFLP